MQKRRDLESLICLTQPLPSGTKNMLIFFEAKEPSIQKIKYGISKFHDFYHTYFRVSTAFLSPNQKIFDFQSSVS